MRQRCPSCNARPRSRHHLSASLASSMEASSTLPAARPRHCSSTAAASRRCRRRPSDADRHPGRSAACCGHCLAPRWRPATQNFTIFPLRRLPGTINTATKPLEDGVRAPASRARRDGGRDRKSTLPALALPPLRSWMGDDAQVHNPRRLRILLDVGCGSVMATLLAASFAAAQALRASASPSASDRRWCCATASIPSRCQARLTTSR